MAGKLENLEKYMAFLATKLQQQEQRNSELVAALAQQEQHRINEKTAFVKAVGVLQGAVTQLSNRVDVIPKMLEHEKRNKYKHSLSSSLNSMSEKIGELGNKLSGNIAQQIQVRDTRSQTAGELLGKLLGKDLEKALEGMTTKNKDKNGEAKDMPLGIDSASQVSTAPASSVIATNTQPLIPMDLLPQSHMTSLSTPSGQGPAGSVSTNPVVPNLSYVQVPSQTNIAAPSTPTGSGPVGSVSTMPITNQAITADPLKTVSLTSVASKFRPPVNVAGYNVLPLAPVVQTQALEPPGTIAAQPGFPSLAAPDQIVPGAVNPYEILTSSQMQPKVAQPVGFNGAAPLSALGSQVANPYEMLTTAQLTPPGISMAKAIQKNRLGKKEKIRQLENNLRKPEREIRSKRIKKVAKTLMNKSKKIGLKKTSRIKKLKNDGEQKINTQPSNDPLEFELKKALKMGNLKEAEHSINMKEKKQN